MSAATLPAPGAVHGAFPERRDAARRPPHRPGRAGLAQARHFVAAVRGADAPRGARRDDILAFRAAVGAFAAVHGVALHDTQLLAARIMLDGHLAEMATGEGKTYAMGLGAVVAARAGAPVHVITANDYLVRRDAALLRPVAAALGLTVGAIEAAMDAAARRAQYACDITYCTASELAFDYLRDRIARDGAASDLEARAARLAGTARAAPVLRGLCLALVDEADSCLIDDARVPLILAEPAPNPARDDFHRAALALARGLAPGRDYRLAPDAMQARLTPAGAARLAADAAALPALWQRRLAREEAVATALAALALYRRDTHYLVREGKVAIIDPGTGRLAAGRSWTGGLHQMIELKEGLPPTPENVTRAQITYQRLFRRFWQVGGMSGTLAEARAELRAVYGLRVIAVPLRTPSRRVLLPTRILRDRERQFDAVVARVRAIVAAGRAVLVGTDSVAESRALAARLGAAGIAHQVLDARMEAAEAEIVAAAGAPARVTVATNIAGRGTDIPLDPAVAARGGLHLICCQHNASARIDRQLVGRAARRGDPGSAETILAANQPLIAPLFPAWLRRLLPENGLMKPRWAIGFLVRTPQWLAERRARRQRRAMLAADAAWDARNPAGVPAE
ncbi:MAG: prepilin peptidase [Burkholderiales bacterium]|nr:prepilin peptidase [Burkholderiales bacterium]